jgi:hypothetical protein
VDAAELTALNERRQLALERSAAGEGESVADGDATWTRVSAYNPEITGTAYYTTKDGGQYRKWHNYKADKAAPGDEGDGFGCRKCFGAPGKKNTAGVWIFVCVLHGWALGFHIMTSAEGRKDPVAACYAYQKEAPNHFFTDFACQSLDYAMHRVPEFYLDTEFWLDVFHSSAHKCSDIFKSRRLPRMRHYDTSLMEQINAFLQVHKKQAKGMTMGHFMFKMQYYLDIWNDRKLELYLTMQAGHNFLNPGSDEGDTDESSTDEDGTDEE